MVERVEADEMDRGESGGGDLRGFARTLTEEEEVEEEKDAGPGGAFNGVLEQGIAHACPLSSRRDVLATLENLRRNLMR